VKWSSSPFDAVRSIVEGAIIGDFDPGYYKSDRKEKDKEQKIDALTIVTAAMPSPGSPCRLAAS